MAPKNDVLVISSHVVRGAVGNRAIAFALERLGHTVWALPTVILPHHPGHGPATPVVAADRAFETMAQEIAAMPALARISGIVSGYFATVAQVEAAARLIAAVKAANPNTVYLCDPVLGDTASDGSGRLYVPAAIGSAVRNHLLPLADIATPNRFECAWLAGAPTRTAGPATQQARALGPATVVVTSHPALMAGQIGNLMVRGSETLLVEHRRVPAAVKGTGDLFAALFLGRVLQGASPAEALEAASNSIFEVVAAAARLDVDEMPLAAAQEAIVRPRRHVGVRRLGEFAKSTGAQ